MVASGPWIISHEIETYGKKAKLAETLAVKGDKTHNAQAAGARPWALTGLASISVEN
jgi:hypothetical protein